jgi:ribonuclease Z
MKRLKIVGLVVLALVVIGGALAWLNRGALAEALMAKVYDKVMASADPVAALPDGLHVGLCGTGSPMADPTRAGPCTVVVAGRRMFVIDSGTGSTKVLSLMNLSPARVDAVFLTHFHSDHIADLGELLLQRWASGAATSPLPLYGPTGVDQVLAGFQEAYTADRGYRIAHHGPKVVPPGGFGGVAHSFAITKGGPNVTLIDEPDLKVIAVSVDHGPVEPAVGYLFIYKGRSVLISGDTVPCATLEAAAKGVDMLVNEGLSPELVEEQRQAALAHGRANLAAILHDILSYHTTPEQAAGMAERAGVHYLLFTHVIPPLPVRALEGPFLGQARTIFKGPIRVGRDGDFLSLPAGSSAIVVHNRLDAFF